MTRSVFEKVAWVGRATVFVVGLAVMLALVFGAATTAMGATGGNFILGKANAATTVSKLTASIAAPALTLVNQSTEAAATALNITVASGKPPIKVNAAAGTATNLSADKLDGKDSSQFLGKTEKAADADHADQADSATSAQNASNADKLDGKDSSQFATTTSEGWHQISASGTSPFNRFYDGWSNFDSQHSTAAYYKDPQGIVHLKGVVKGGGFGNCCFNTEQGMIFLLPQGYWPSEHRVFTAVSGSNTTVGRIDIGRGGCLATENIPSGTCGAAVQAVGGSSGWITLDGISFRAEG